MERASPYDALLTLAVFAGAAVLWFVGRSPDLFFAALTVASGVLYGGYALRRRRPAHEFADSDAYEKHRKPVGFWRDFFIIFLAVFIFRGFFYTWFSIPSNSMQPTLTVGDFVLVDRWQYGMRVPLLDSYITEGDPPARGDIIVFRHPDSEIVFIKRVMAVPGDTIIIRSGKVEINGEVLQTRRDGPHRYSASNGDFYREAAKYLERVPDAGWHGMLRDTSFRSAISPQPKAEECAREAGGRALRCQVPEGEYFVLGDNRDHSNDSRFWGFVPRANIVGPALAVMFNFRDWSRAGESLALLEPDSSPSENGEDDSTKPDS